MIIRTLCDADTPFAKALNSKRAEVMWHVSSSKPLKEVSQLASFLQALGIDTKNAARLGIGKTFFVTSEDGKTVYDPEKSPEELGLKNGCTARISLNRSQVKPKPVEAKKPEEVTSTSTPSAKPKKEQKKHVQEEVAPVRSLGDTARSSQAEAATRQSSVSFAPEIENTDVREHPADQNVVQDQYEEENYEGGEHGPAAVSQAVLNVDEYLAHIDNATLQDELAEMMDKLNDRLAVQLRSDFAREEEALRRQVVQGKLDELVLHICRRQVLKMQQIQQLMYEKQVLRTLQERRRQLQPGEGEGADGSSMAPNMAARNQFQTTSLGEQLSRSYFPSILQLL